MESWGVTLDLAWLKNKKFYLECKWIYVLNVNEYICNKKNVVEFEFVYMLNDIFVSKNEIIKCEWIWNLWILHQSAEPYPSWRTQSKQAPLALNRIVTVYAPNVCKNCAKKIMGIGLLAFNEGQFCWKSTRWSSNSTPAIKKTRRMNSPRPLALKYISL